MSFKNGLSNILLSAIAGGLKLIGGLILLKYAVNEIGSENLVYLGQFNSIFMFASIICSAGLFNGTVSALSRGFGLAKTTDLIILFIILFGFGLLFLLALSEATLSNDFALSYPFLFIACILLIPFFISELLLAIINVNFDGKYSYYVKSLSVFMSLIFGWLLINNVDNGGMLINTTYGLSSALSAGIFLLYLRRSVNKKVNVCKNIGNDGLSLIFYKPFILSALVSISFMPISKIATRSYLIESTGEFSASHFQSFLTISDAYSVIFVVFLTSFYVRFISSKNNVSIMRVFRDVIWILFAPLLIAFSVVAILWKPMLDFILGIRLENANLNIAIFIVGDIFRYLSLLVSYNFLVRGNSKAVLISELIQSFLFLALITTLSSAYGLTGSVMGYAITYITLFAFLTAIAKSKFCALVVSRHGVEE